MSWSGFALNVALSAGAVVLALLVVWRIGARLRDMSLIDIFWGPGFVVVALVTLSVGDAPLGRRLLRKALLERRMRKTRPGYEDYVARTSGFFPRPPKAA